MDILGILLTSFSMYKPIWLFQLVTNQVKSGKKLNKQQQNVCFGLQVKNELNAIPYLPLELSP